MRITRVLDGRLAPTLLAALVAVLVALAMGTPLAAQQTPEDRIQAAFDRARARDLPIEVLESKLAEGRAKNVPIERIAQAIQRRAQAMERAHTALQRAQQDRPATADVAIGTDAIEAGVTEAMLERVAATAGAERRTVAIAALAYLVAEGHAPQAALDAVEGALARGGQALTDLPGMARHGPGIGGPPDGVPPAGRPAGAGPPRGPPGGPPDGI